MNILIATMDLSSNGIDTWVKQFSIKLSEKYGNSLRISILSLGGVFNENYKIYEKRGIKVHIVPRYREKIPIISSIIASYNVLMSEKFDIIHINHDFSSVILSTVALICGIKIRIIHAHTTSYSKKKLIKITSRIFRRLIPYVGNYYFAISNQTKNLFFCSKNIDSKKVFIVKNAIDYNDYEYSEYNREAVRKELELNDKILVLGQVGRLSSEKNQKFHLDIADKLDSSKYVHLIFGKGPDFEKLTKIITERKMSNVFLMGESTNINFYYSAMDLLLMPSYYEGVPFTLIEAQANGLPIIMSDNIDPDVIISRKVFPIKLNEELWVDMINDYYSKYVNSNHKREADKLNYKYYDYSIHNEVDKVFELYKKFMNERG